MNYLTENSLERSCCSFQRMHSKGDSLCNGTSLNVRIGAEYKRGVSKVYYSCFLSNFAKFHVYIAKTRLLLRYRWN